MKFFNTETDGNIDLGEKRKIITGTLNGMGVNNNLLKAKSAFQGFLLQSEVDFIIEKSWIAKTCEYIYKVVDGIQPNRYVIFNMTSPICANLSIFFFGIQLHQQADHLLFGHCNYSWFLSLIYGN